MYYCDKCGEKISDPSKPCSTCGLVLNSFDDTKNEKKFPINIGVVLLVFITIIVSVAFMQNVFSTVLVNHVAANYSLDYNNVVWSEYQVNDNFYALVNNVDKETYLQFPVEAQELGVVLSNKESLEYLHSTYVYALSTSTELSYNNIAANIKRLDNTNYYYLTADYVSFENNSKGKLYIILTEEGKALNILLNLGSSNLLDVEEDIYEILKSINM